MISSFGITTVAAVDGQEALESLASRDVDAIVTDLVMPRVDGFELLRKLSLQGVTTPAIVLTGFRNVDKASSVVRDLKAFWFLEKPVQSGVLRELLERAIIQNGLIAEKELLQRQLQYSGVVGDLVGASPAMQEVFRAIGRLSQSNVTVLITGESGTGKELLAKAIHNASPRRAKPFVAINCSAMAENLLESELFGHIKGSFTGAVRDHQGLFQAADGGTLLLDEIGDMPMRLQVKLLRVLQENNIRPIGATDAIPVNVRVISATHRDLQQLMMSGQFREDLYYRLNVVHIEMPPLNRRREDIPLLVSHFLAQISNESGVRKIYAPEAVELLATADWPGNIRQLANVVRQNVALSQTPIIPVELVQQSLGGTQSKLPSFDEARDEFTRSYLSQILQITGGNVSQAARLAKRNRTDFYKLLSRHQLTPEDFKGR